jgi:hypothetical protein
VVRRVCQAGAVERVRPLLRPLVLIAALVECVLKGRDGALVGAPALLRAGQILGAEQAVRRAFGRLGRTDLVGVLLLVFLQRRLLEGDVGVEPVVLRRKVDGLLGGRPLLGLRRGERGLRDRELARRRLLGRRASTLHLGELIEVLQAGAERAGRQRRRVAERVARGRGRLLLCGG